MMPHGRGLALRREFAGELLAQHKRDDIDFLEVTADNWMGLGGESRELIDGLAEKYPLVAHGLSLSIGDALPVDETYLRAIGDFLDRLDIEFYSDHLSLSRDRQGYLYELLPMPRTTASLVNAVEKVKRVQGALCRRIALENTTVYVQDAADIPEDQFIAQLIDASDCRLLLDVNNLYVNARNHGTDPIAFLDAVPCNAVSYVHVAGHQDDGEGALVMDTHGAPVSAAVITLAGYAARRFGARPIVLERDHHVPSLDALCDELASIDVAIKSESVKCR
jgi:uncharacterized protein (UPF0276 family)